MDSLDAVKPESGPASGDFVPKLVATKCVGADRYRQQIAGDSSFSTPVFDKEAESNSILPAAADCDSLEAGKTYYWRVKARKGGAWGGWSTTSGTFTLAAITSSYSPTEDSTLGESKPVLSWAALTGAASYEIKTAADSAGLATATASGVTSPTFTPAQSFPNNSKVYWKIRSISASGASSGWSGLRSFTVSWNPSITLASPTDGSTIAQTEPLLDWDDASGAASYEVQIADTSADLAAAATVAASSSQYQISTAIANNATKYWRVRPINGDGVAGAWGSTWSFTVALPIPSQSSPTDAATLTDTTPDFAWGAVTGAAAYRFQLSTSSSFGTTVADVATLTSANYTQSAALANNATYYWHVAWKNADGGVERLQRCAFLLRELQSWNRPRVARGRRDDRPDQAPPGLG